MEETATDILANVKEEFKNDVLRYEEAKLKIKECEAVIDELKPHILVCLPEDTNLQTEKGYFFIMKKAKWTYTAETQAREADLKKVKKDEEAKGDATAEYASVLFYKEGVPTA